jgi:transposase
MVLGRYILAPPERQELKRRARSRSLVVESVRRAKVILMLAAGDSYSGICERFGCTDRYISLWKERFQQERLSGLDSRYRGAEHRRRTAETEAGILEVTRRGPTDGSTHWSSYRLAKEVGVSQSTVSRVWRQFLTGRVVIWPVMIQSLKRKRRTSSACTSNHRHTPRSSA